MQAMLAMKRLGHAAATERKVLFPAQFTTIPSMLTWSRFSLPRWSTPTAVAESVRLPSQSPVVQEG